MRQTGLILILLGIIALILPLLGFQNRLILLAQVALGQFAWMVPSALVLIGVVLFLASGDAISIRSIKRGFRRPREFTEGDAASIMAMGYPTKEQIINGSVPGAFRVSDVDRVYPYLDEIMRRLWRKESIFEVAADIAHRAGYNIPHFVINLLCRLDQMDIDGRFSSVQGSPSSTTSRPPSSP